MPTLWWKYIELYRDCLHTLISNKKQVTMNCHTKIYKDLEISAFVQHSIEECITNSKGDIKKDFFETSNLRLKENENER